MSRIAGEKEGPPIVCYYAVKNTYDIDFPGNIASNTLVFKAWQYAGASLAVDRDAVASPTYDAGTGKTDVRFTLTAADSTISWSRGRYSVHDETADVVLMEGPLLIKQVPHS